MTALMIKGLKILGRVFAWICVLFLVAFLMPYLRDWYDNWREGDPYLKVWVNPEGNIYYGPGETAHGNTIPGFYLSQSDARAANYRSANFFGLGYGSPARPLKTNGDWKLFEQSWLSLADKTITLSLNNGSTWQITDIAIRITTNSGFRRTYRLIGRAKPKQQIEFRKTVEDLPSGEKWEWSFVRIRGFPPE